MPIADMYKTSVWDQKLFWSRIRMLLLMKHSRPDIANATQELSKVTDGANQALSLEIHHITKFVLDTWNLSLNMGYHISDSDDAEDPVTRRSVSGFILYVLSVQVY